MNKFWLCGSFYSASGRMSRSWVEASESSPDTAVACNEAHECEIRKGECQNDNEHTPYPFNGMGGRVLCGPCATKKEAEEFLNGDGPFKNYDMYDYLSN